MFLLLTFASVFAAGFVTLARFAATVVEGFDMLPRVAVAVAPLAAGFEILSRELVEAVLVLDVGLELVEVADELRFKVVVAEGGRELAELLALVAVLTALTVLLLEVGLEIEVRGAARTDEEAEGRFAVDAVTIVDAAL